MNFQKDINAFETYPIPSIFYPKISKFENVFYSICFLGSLFLLVLIIASGKPWNLYIYGTVLLLILPMVLGYIFVIYIQVSKKIYLELTETSIKQKSLFKEQSMDWDKIDSVSVFSVPRGGQRLKIKGSIIMDGQFLKPEEIVFISIQFSYISLDKLIHTINKNKTLMSTKELWNK